MLPSRVLAVDVEATCLRGPDCRVVAAAAVPVDDGYVKLSEAIYVVEPGGSGASALVHGVTSGSKRLGSLDLFLKAVRGSVIVTYGPHDARLLAAEARRRGIPLGRLCYIDVLEALLRSPTRLHEALSAGSYTLERAVSDVLGVRAARRRFHNPLDDAVYAALLYIHLERSGVSLRQRCLDADRAGRGFLTALLAQLRQLGRRLLS